MNIGLLFHTVCYLRPIQIFYQIRYRVWKPYYKEYSPSITDEVFVQTFISKPICLTKAGFSFLNISCGFNGWNDTSNGMLWAYNLNYMDWLNQSDMTLGSGKEWIDRFIDELPKNKVGLDPYPIALRGINWIKFIIANKDKIDDSALQKWHTSLYSQYCLLIKKMEYHLLGNHLLEDACSLFIASIYFNDNAFYKKSVKLLRRELNEQILSDGAHYEQSPMYHCIMLDRILDCYNFSFNNCFFEGQETTTAFLREKAELMLGHLENITYENGDFPLLNDSAINIAPTSEQLFAYAHRLGLVWQPIQLSECGYRKFSSQDMEAFVDVGNITASYQPGHSHADTFSYELRLNGAPFIVDTGISTYNKTSRRQFERSTPAHNTVSVNGCNSSEVWGGFRVGNRASVKILKDDASEIKAVHDGFGKNNLHTRRFRMTNTSFEIQDCIKTEIEAVSYIHLAPEVHILSQNGSNIQTDEAEIVIDGYESLEITDGTVSVEYNTFIPIKIIKIHFCREMSYRIIPVC